MVTMQEIDRQLKAIGASFHFWGMPEIRELQQILMPGEQIKACMNGRWEGGWALLCVTNWRILLVDKKIMYLTLEDIRFDMVVEVDYGYRFLDATIRICTPNKTLAFTAYKKDELRKAVVYIQTRVMEVRQMHMMQQQPEPAPQPQPIAPVSPYVANNVEPAPKPLIPQLPIGRLMNPYTQAPLSTRKRVPKFYS